MTDNLGTLYRYQWICQGIIKLTSNTKNIEESVSLWAIASNCKFTYGFTRQMWTGMKGT